MKSNYKPIGKYIRLVDERNTGLKIPTLLGLSISKEFIPSVANIIGSDMENYKIIRRNQFACSLMQVRRDKKMPVALLKEMDEAIISQAYPVFEVIDPEILLPEYLMMWFSRPEFDREACFYAVGGVRGGLEWEDLCAMQLPVPAIEKQKEIVKEYHTIVNRIKLNQQLNRKLEETAQAIYKQWFVGFEFPDEDGNPYKSSGGEMVVFPDLDKEIPKGWTYIPLKKLTTKIGSGSTPLGGKSGYKSTGIPFVRSMNVFDYTFSYNEMAFISDTQAKKLQGVALEPHDVLLNITGVSVARCCKVPLNILPAYVNQHVSIIRLKPDFPTSTYLMCSLCNKGYKAILLGTSEGGSTRQALTKTNIEDTFLLVPKKDVLESFENKSRRLFNYKEQIGQQINCLESVSTLLLASMASKQFDDNSMKVTR
jgi:type I restriction enzyme S subunit